MTTAGKISFRSIDPYSYLQPWWPRERFTDLANEYGLPAMKVWLMYAIAPEDRTSDVPYLYDPKKRKFDLSRLSDPFIARFQQMISDHCGVGRRILLVYRDGATWNTDEWPYDRWNAKNNRQRLITEDFEKAREAGPTGDRKDDQYMRAVWYPLVDKVISMIQPKYRPLVTHIPTSEPRKSWHPTRHMVEYLRHRGVPRAQIALSGLNMTEWRGLPASDPLKTQVGRIRVHGVRDVKQADAAIADLVEKYQGIEFDADSDGGRAKDGKYLSGKGMFGQMTGMTPAWWRGVLKKYPSSGMLLGMWYPRSDADFKAMLESARPLFRVVGEMQDA